MYANVGSNDFYPSVKSRQFPGAFATFIFFAHRTPASLPCNASRGVLTGCIGISSALTSIIVVFWVLQARWGGVVERYLVL